MKQKLLCFAIVLVMILSVCGCGSSADSSLTEEGPAEVGEAGTYSATPATQSYSEAEVYEVEDTYTVDELVMMIESGEISLVDVYMQVANGDINESEDILYEVENIITEFEAEKARNASGIVVVKIVVDQIRTWDSTGTFHSQPFTVYLDVINPDTGDVSNFKTFSSMETHSCSLGYYGKIGGNTSVIRKYFNSDFTKMVATLTMEDGAVHVGWIDEDGNFTDVSERVSHSSEFGGLMSHKQPYFYHDYFYFMDSTEESGQIMRVPIDNLSEASVEVLEDEGVYSHENLYIYPDESADTNNFGMWEFSDESMMYAAPGNTFNDWISTTECVGTEHFIYDMIYKYVVKQKDSYIDTWYSEKIALVPEVKGRDNWNAVVSPEGERIAFLSRLNSGTDHSTSLFIVSIDGGEPTKVNTSYDLGNPDNYNNIVALFDWR